MAKISDLTLVQVAVTKTPEEILKANSNTAVEILLEEVKELRDFQKKIKTMEGILTNLMYSRLPDGPLTPETYDKYDGHTLMGINGSEGTISQVVQSRFDTQKFKKDHPDLHKKYSKVIAFVQLKFAKASEGEAEDGE